MKKMVIGILAHVDAGKTTLSEALLYLCGSIRKIGRVDRGDAFLDTYELERARGITIFSKQAVLAFGDTQVTLLDTPGHVDFSAEMERTLQVLDYAILVISGADGVQGHTRTLWRLLKQYGIPVFIFVNKMDQPGTDRAALLKELKERLDEGCMAFSEETAEAFYENIAMCREDVLEDFLREGKVSAGKIQRLIKSRALFPCYFGSALKLDGVKELIGGVETYSAPPESDILTGFGARVFKIARDEQGNRLTYLKVTGGSLKVRTTLTGQNTSLAEFSLGQTTDRGTQVWEEKVNQIRIYSGSRYEVVTEAPAGTVCAVTGLTKVLSGQGLGMESGVNLPLLSPVLTYVIKLPKGGDAASMLPKLRELEEEEPQLHIAWNEKLQEIQAMVMGEVQIQVLKSLIAQRFGVEVEIGGGSIVYKETICNTVEGVGHFEPLKHYAEVHILIEPGEPGSGVQTGIRCSEDVLDKNWQRLILTHLEEKEHLGVLTGSPVTDIRITLVSGKAHIKHTEGGDFRQATYRAVRQGLMQAKSVLLEPYYEFLLEVPEQMAGRAMADVERMYGSFSPPVFDGGIAVIPGCAPVAAMSDYQREVAAYTRGHGKLFVSVKGYEPCHNQEEVIGRIGYDCDRDGDNLSGSVFCAHGAGFVVPWDQVHTHMHLDSCLEAEKGEDGDDSLFSASPQKRESRVAASLPVWMGDDEVEKIFSQTFYANSRKNGKKDGRDQQRWKRTPLQLPAAELSKSVQKAQVRESYLLVDGYNIVFAWEELKELARDNIDGARERLLEILSNYQGMRKCNLMVVFDAYRVQGHKTELLDYHNIHVVFTKEAETADQYIEKFAQENGRTYDVTVATSDGLEQIIILGRGCRLLSAREFLAEVRGVEKEIREVYEKSQPGSRNYLLDVLSKEQLK